MHSHMKMETIPRMRGGEIKKMMEEVSSTLI
jgi:hypothetical protein